VPRLIGTLHPPHSQPTGLLNVKVDGRRTYFEWINAGHYACRGARGTMAMAQQGLVGDVFFGFDHKYLYLRLDARGGPVRERLAKIGSLRVFFFQPDGYEVVVSQPGKRAPAAKLCKQEAPLVDSGVEAAADLIFEMAVPLAGLKAKTDDPIHFFLELIQEGKPVERVPQEGAIETVVPAPDYELIMWQA
jgi:hypothetical protein